MPQPQEVPIFDLNIFAGITVDLDFEARVVNEEGVDQGAMDLTGKVLHFITWNVFRPDLQFDSSGGPTDQGSSITINVDPTTGLFNLHLSGEDLEGNVLDTGGYRIEMPEGNDADLLVRGTINVVPFETGSAV